jgi:hypothetical protein
VKLRNLVLAFVPASLALVLVVLAGLFIASSPPAAAQAQPASAGRLAPGGDVCGTWWGPEQAPDPGPDYNTRLFTMDALSANDVWAVGEQETSSNGIRTGYVLHWNGVT